MIFLNQIDICWILFIQFYCAGSHTEHCWRCSFNMDVGRVSVMVCALIGVTLLRDQGVG
jgi:hypothetical protein